MNSEDLTKMSEGRYSVERENRNVTQWLEVLHKD